MNARKRLRFNRRTVLTGSIAAVPAVVGIAGGSSLLVRRASPAALAVAVDDQVQELVTGNTEFALDAYAEVRRSANGNVLMSPYSISQALAMTYAGADGRTATQIADALVFRLDGTALHEAFGELNAELIERGNAEGDASSGQAPRGLRIANALWGEESYRFSRSYSQNLEQSYGAGLQPTDFINAPEQAREDINDWVAEQTEDRIQNIVPEGDVTSDTRLVLANAIYFYGSWDAPFNPNNTRDDTFFLPDGETASVPFMFRHDYLSYAQGDGFQSIEFPYAGDAPDLSGFVFTVIMPDDGQFEQFENGLDTGTLNAAIDHMSSTEVLVYLPKFTFEFAANLNDVLQALGMDDAFDPDRADFSGMVEGTPPEPLYLGNVLHKAFISLDENGTEAAAATVVEMTAGAAEPTEKPPEVHIDHPFIFAIRDTQSGTILFLGRMIDPST